MSTNYDTGYENGSLAALEHVKPEIDALKARVKKLVEALSVLYFSAIELSDFWAYGLRKADSEEDSAVARRAARVKAERLGGEISDACKKAKQAIEGN